LAQEGTAQPGNVRAVTLSERQRVRRVAPGKYLVKLDVAGTTMTRPIEVRAETDGVRRVLVRK
jgi:hypothetical protein